MTQRSPEELPARRRAKLRRRRLRWAAVGAACALVLAGGLGLALLGDPKPELVRAKPEPRLARARPRPVRAAPAAVAIAVTGDITLGNAPQLPPDGGATLFARVTRLLRGDIVLGNLEGTLARDGASKCRSEERGCYAFRAPPAYARRLKEAGFTILNLANNHTYDYGAAGQAETAAALARFGLGRTGRPGEIAYRRVHGLRVAVVGFAPYSWAQSLLDLDGARRLVRTADARADLVLVTMHAGAEGARNAHVRPGGETYLGERRGDAIAFAHAVIDAGADLVAGSGPHVLRGLEWYRGRLIAYSLGNFTGYRTLDVSGVLGASAILEVTLRADGSWQGGRLVPVRLGRSGLPSPDPRRAALALVRTLSREDFGRRAVRVSRTGALSPPGR